MLGLGVNFQPNRADPSTAMVEAIAIAGAALIATTLLVRAARAYHTLAPVEMLVLWWWGAICACGLALIVHPVYPVVGSTGVLMLGLGLLLALDYHGISKLLSNRRIGFLRAGFRYSPTRWRLQGAFLAAIGVIWTLAFGQAF